MLVASAAEVAAVDTAPLQLGVGERLLVIAPHPDDEILAAGGLMTRVLDRGGTVWVALVTAGDGYVASMAHDAGGERPDPASYISYGERRLREAHAAARIIGKDRVRVQVLGFPDGALADLLDTHWRRSHPKRSQTTAASRPPYREVIDPSVEYTGADLHRELVQLLRETQPTTIVFPDPRDCHPDHGATGTFSLLAVATWKREARGPGTTTPRLLAYLVHWPNWPPGWYEAPRSRLTDEPLHPPANLPDDGLGRTVLILSDGEVGAKARALSRYASQQELMPSFVAAFVRRTEPFGVFTIREVQRASTRSAARRWRHAAESRGTHRRLSPLKTSSRCPGRGSDG